MFISLVMIRFIAFFISDFLYKTLICDCYFIRMLTSQLIFDLIWHNTMLFWFCLFVLLWTISNSRKVLQVSSHFDSSKWCAWDDPSTKISRDPELTDLTRNHRTWCMLLRSKYCTQTQCCCIWLTCKTFQRDVSFKIYKGLLHMNDNYICVRRCVVSDPELPDSLYRKNILK